LGLTRARHAVSGGEAIGEDTFLFFRALGANFKQGYGLTETAGFGAAMEDGDLHFHSVGKPLPDVEFKITKEGEILVRGASVFDEYYNNPEATAKALEDGWFHTGDAGYLEEDGHLVILGRAAEVVYTVAEERYVPNFIENQLKFNPFIKDAAVVGSGKVFLGAIICIDLEAAGHWAEIRGITYTSYADLSQKPQIYGLIEEGIQKVNKVLLEGLRIKKFVNLHKEFDPDDGELTRTRKLRRKVIEERYRLVIEAIYGTRDSVEIEALITYESGDTGVIRRNLGIKEVR
jgi:long-chain acyl-CoA synthetase